MTTSYDETLKSGHILEKWWKCDTSAGYPFPDFITHDRKDIILKVGSFT